jgi:hypothetical protein
MQKVLLVAILAVVAAATAFLITSEQAHALCAEQDMQGTWVNEDPNTRSLTRVIITFPCNDVVAVPVGGEAPEPDPDTIHVYGACHPTDCDWGVEEIADKYWSRTQSQYTYARAYYDHSFANRTLHVYRLSEDRIVVYTWTRFTDDSGRDSYSSVDYFSKVSP